MSYELPSICIRGLLRSCVSQLASERTSASKPPHVFRKLTRHRNQAVRFYNSKRCFFICLLRFGWDVCLGTLALFGCPTSSIKGKDVHSDREAARLFNPAYMKENTYDNVGWDLFQFWNHITFGGWTSSEAFTVPEMYENCLSAYYLTLINSMISWNIRENKMTLIWLPLQTLKNIVRMLGNLLLRLHGWPLEAVFEPVYTMENAIEFWFGQVKTFKRGVHGTATTANSIMAAQLLHFKQAKKVPKAGLGWSGRSGYLLQVLSFIFSIFFSWIHT